MERLFRISDETEKARKTPQDWPVLHNKLDLLITGDVIVLEGPSRKEVVKARKVSLKHNKRSGKVVTWDRYYSTPERGEVKGKVGQWVISETWRIVGRMVGQIRHYEAA